MGNDLHTYPTNFTDNYIIAYGIIGTVSDVDAGKTYDFHTAFDIKPTKVIMNVDLDMNNKKLTNVSLDTNDVNNAATVKMDKDLETKVHPHTNNRIYREIFGDFYDLTSDADKFKLTLGSSGITFSEINPNLTYPQRTITDVDFDGLRFVRQTLNLASPDSSKFTLYIVMKLCSNRSFNFHLFNRNLGGFRVTPTLKYAAESKRLILATYGGQTHIDLLNQFNGKRVLLWLAENKITNVTKVAISNYSATLTGQSSKVILGKHQINLYVDDARFHRIMYSPNFYDFFFFGTVSQGYSH